MFADVLCLSHLRWEFVFQRPNHLMARCARGGRRVVFFEEPVFDATSPYLAAREVAPGLTVAAPHLPAGTPRDAAERMQRRLVDQALARQGALAPLLWFYTPMALAFAGHVKAAGVVYDCMDELSNFRGAPPELRERERALLDRADVVFTGGHALFEAKRTHHPNVHAFPSSVDAPHFAAARERGLSDPHDQRAIGRPRAGFFGVLDERLDLDLLRLLADARPSWHFVLLGPVVKIDPATLPKRPNLHYLGMKAYRDLPAYASGWDAAILPFALNDATRFISPTKTLEYLAAGLPVVSTPIRDVARPYGERGLVRIGEGEAFVRALDDAMADRGTPADAARRRAVDALVADTSWDKTWDRMHALVRDALAARARVA